MVSLILGALALAAFVALIAAAPRDPWETDSEFWYEQFGSRPRRDTFAEELMVMRLEAELLRGQPSVAASPARAAGRSANPVPSASA